MKHFFHLIHTHVWKSMIIVVALTNDDYDESPKEKNWTCDLQEEVVDMKQILKCVRSTWAKYGCLIVTNGWFVIKKKTLWTWFFQLVWALIFGEQFMIL
jgi:hypothetical protein